MSDGACLRGSESILRLSSLPIKRLEGTLRTYTNTKQLGVPSGKVACACGKGIFSIIYFSFLAQHAINHSALSATAVSGEPGWPVHITLRQSASSQACHPEPTCISPAFPFSLLHVQAARLPWWSGDGTLIISLSLFPLPHMAILSLACEGIRLLHSISPFFSVSLSPPLHFSSEMWP